MKLEKGYTYPQFIKLIDGNSELTPREKWNKLVNFDKRCDQTLTKEILVNELNEPEEVLMQGNGFTYDANEDELKAWQEAEKKVIFKDVKYIREQDYHVFYIGGDELWTMDFINWHNSGDYVIDNLGTFFDLNHGELITQNIEI